MNKLIDLAYARSGDKGAHANIGVVARTPEYYKYLEKFLTAERVHHYFLYLNPQKTERFLLPNLLAFNFILYGILDGGASLSLRTDGQGKCLGQALLQMPIKFSMENMYDGSITD